MLIRVVDLETTGLAPPEAVCEIGWCDLTLSGGTWHVGRPETILVDPGRPIPPEVAAVHHITDDDVRGAALWAEALESVLSPFDPAIAVLAAHNAKFERQWLTEQAVGGLPWLCTYKAAMRLWPDAPAHRNQVLRYWRNPAGLDRQVANAAHRAGPDAYVTAHLLRDMLARASVDDLVRWTAEPALQTRCQFGKWRGTPWREVDTGFLQWVLGKDFDEDVIFTVKSELDRRARAA